MPFSTPLRASRGRLCALQNFNIFNQLSDALGARQLLCSFARGSNGDLRPAGNRCEEFTAIPWFRDACAAQCRCKVMKSRSVETPIAIER